MRQEFIEVIIRVAIIKYKEQADNDISDAVAMLVTENLVPYIPVQGQIDCDDFRRSRFYLESTETVVNSNIDIFSVLYAKYKHHKSVGGLSLFSLPQWMQFLKDVGLIGSDDGDFTTREAMLAFFNSRMIVVDEVKSRNKFISLTFLDFLEAVARIADMISIPTDEDIASLEEGGYGEVRNMFEYRVKRATITQENLKKRLLERRPSSEALTVSERPLSEKLSKMLEIIMANYAHGFKGVLQYEKKNIKLVPKFICEDQLVKH